MRQSRLRLSAAIIAALILVGFILSVPHTEDAHKEATMEKETIVPAVSLTDSFKRGTHTLSGSIEVADACTSVVANALPLIEASTTQAITLELSVLEDSGLCLELPNAVKFSTTIDAPEDLPIQVFVDGTRATTTP